MIKCKNTIHINLLLNMENFQIKNLNHIILQNKCSKKGVFEGKYLNDCTKEFPQEWFEESKNKRTIIANPELNYFKIKSRLSLQQWKYNGWIPIINGDKDIRGWFQWYCRYFIGRRCETDHIQISRWKSFIRHRGQIDASIKRMPISKRPKTITNIKKHRPKQRQALLQWSHKCT